MTRHALVTALCCSLALGACQNPNYTATGALGGAAVGGALGTLAGGDDRRNALIGAGIGLLAGTAAGAYMDRQRQALERDVAGTGAEVIQRGDQILVSMPGGVTFETDSAAIRPGFQGTLSRVAGTLGQYPQSYVDVVGHTDSTGDAGYNQRLSERRADAVAGFLQGRGVAPARIVAYGEGETNPVASNDTPEGRARNRRVEILVTAAES